MLALDFIGNNWKCDRGYKKSNNLCVPMSKKEIQQQNQILKQVVRKIYRRKIQGIDCSTEYKTNAEVCIKRTHRELDCNKSYDGSHFTDCDVTLSYDIQTDYRGGTYIDADVECEVEIEYKGKQRYYAQSDSNSESESHSLYAHDSKSETMEFNFSFSSYQEITRVKIRSASCEIDSLNLQ